MTFLLCFVTPLLVVFGLFVQAKYDSDYFPHLMTLFLSVAVIVAAALITAFPALAG